MCHGGTLENKRGVLAKFEIEFHCKAKFS